MFGWVECARDGAQKKGGEFGHDVWVVVVLMAGMRLYVGQVDRDGERCDRCADEC